MVQPAHSRSHVFVVRDSLILVLQQAGGLRWCELPGGDLEPGEGPTDAAVRETFEETALWIDAPELLRTWSYRNTRGEHVACYAYVTLAPDGDVRLSAEHRDHAWMTPTAYAERYCNEMLGEAAPQHADFLAEMRRNCELLRDWLSATKGKLASPSQRGLSRSRKDL